MPLHSPLRLPLSRWADSQMALLRQLSASPAIVAIDGATLLGERAMLNGFAVQAGRSAGGGCHWLATRDGHIAINLSRADDRAMMPALFCTDSIDGSDDAAIVAAAMCHSTDELVAQGRLIGLAIAARNEQPASPAIMTRVASMAQSREPRARPPLVIDLSNLWAGPLAGHLLAMMGADVIKVESRDRPDSMRDGDPALFALINQRKANVALDLRDAADRAALIALIRRADVVIEAARPRALLQLGIDADALVRERPALLWLTITGHGDAGDAGEWIGFGDDTAVAGGLSTASGFVGDAMGDPLTGIVTARTASQWLGSGLGGRLILSMSAIVAEALASERARDPEQLGAELAIWANAVGTPFPAVKRRATGTVAALGADNQRWLTG